MRCSPILFCKNCNKRAYRQHLYIFLTMRKMLTMKTLGTVTLKKISIRFLQIEEL